MAFKFNAILKFNGAGVQKQLGKAQRGFKTMANSVAKASQSVAKLGQGIKGLTLAGAPLTAGVAIATKEFADFEKQMSVVKALTQPTAQEFKALEAEAKRMGATTAFTAKEAGQGMEFLALAGFKAKDQIGSIGPLLNLAAAGSLELGSASDIVTDSMGSLAPALDKNKTKVENLTALTDKFAFIQAKTNTNVTQLGEAIKFGGGAMAAAKIPLDSILVAMGGLANAGLKGSIAGTGLTSAFGKMSKPTKKAAAKFDELGIKLRDANDNFLPMPQLIANISKGMGSVEGGAEKMAVAQELFGKRGQRAIFALMNEGTKNLQLLEDGIKNSAGQAALQAATRLDNLAGSFTLMKSAVSGVLIETGGLVGKFLTKPIKVAADNIANFAVGFQIVSGAISKTSKGGEAFFKLFGKEKGEAILGFIDGFVTGFQEVTTEITRIGKKIFGFFNKFAGQSNMSTKSIGNLVAKIITIGAIAAPILAGLAAAFFVVGPIITGISGVVGLASSAFGLLVGAIQIVGGAIAFLMSPVGLLVAGLALVGIAVFNMIGGLQGIKEAAVTFGAGFTQAFNPVISVLKEALMPAFMEVKSAFNELMTAVFGQTSDAKNDLTSFGQDVGSAMATAAKAIVPVVSAIAKLIAGIIRFTTGGVQKGIEIAKSIGSFLGFGGGEARVKVTGQANNSGKVADAVQQSASIQKESVQQKALVQPASAEQTAKAIAVQGAAGQNVSGGGGSGGGTTKVVLELRGDAGKLMNKMVTEDQINNSFEQGKDVKSKFKARSNGAAFAN